MEPIEYSNNYVGYKIKIFPTLQQIQYLWKAFGATRYLYNWAIDKEEEKYNADGGFLSKFDLINMLPFLKEEKPWLKEINSTTLARAFIDVECAFKKFFKKLNKYPVYKSKKSVCKSIFIRPERLTIYEDNAIIPGLGSVQCGAVPDKFIIGTGYSNKENYKHYYNPHIVYDGVSYYLTVDLLVQDGAKISTVKNDIKATNKSSPIGIDLGCKPVNWIVDSNKVRVDRPINYHTDLKIQRLHKKLSRQLKNDSRTKTFFTRSINSLKTQKKLHEYYQKRTRRKMDKIHNYVSHDIIAKNPEYVVIEDIHVTDWLKSNPKAMKSSKIRYKENANAAMINTIQEVIMYKCSHNGIPVYKADSHFPSTKRCNKCGAIQNMYSNRVYKCKVCGYVEDRDINAALNLRDYPLLNFSYISD